MKNKNKILLTSFQTWLSHQNSNSSDDLLAKIQNLDYSNYADLFFLRKLPVDIESSSQKVIDEIKCIEPNVVICCGMAEKRDKLTIESNAFCEDECLHTSINSIALTQQLVFTEISHDAGKFVCEGLYYRVLKYIRSHDRNIQCIFIHVPLITQNNSALILRDFHFIIMQFA